MGKLIVTFFRRRYKQSEVVKLLFSNGRIFTSFVVEEVDGLLSVSPCLLAFNFFSILVNTLILYPLFWEVNQLYDETSLLQSLKLFKMVLFTLCQVTSVFSQVIHLEEMRQIINSMVILDDIFSRIGSKNLVFEGPPLFYPLYNTIVLTIQGILQFSDIKSLLSHRGLSFVVNTTWLAFVMQMNVFCFCFLANSVDVSLSYLNNSLIIMRYSDLKLGRLNSETVELCCKAYNTLCSQVDRMNTVFGAHLLVVFITCFIQIVDQLYFMFSLSTSQFNVKIGQILVTLVWITFAFSIVISITKTCDATAVKAKEFNTLFYQLMLDDRTSGISSNKKLRLHVSMKREVNFTACGFFTLDYTLLHSIVAAATTYLVILIQFGQPSSDVSNVKNTFLNATPT